MAAYRLMNALKNEGVKVKMLVKYKDSSNPSVISLTESSPFNRVRAFIIEYWERLKAFAFVSEKSQRFNFSEGKLGLNISSNKSLLDADVVHFHWINKAFISISQIREMASLGKPVVFTLHDMWYFSGGCHYADKCEKYKEQCGNCPILKTSNPQDLSHQVWREKDEAINQLNCIAVACSSWLGNSASQSSIWRDKRVRSINNPIDTEFFIPASGVKPSSDHTIKLLFIARDISERRKGLDLLFSAIRHLQESNRITKDTFELILVGGGNIGSDQNLMKCDMKGFVRDADELLSIYHQGDVFLLPSREDNLPNTLVEASACGMPAIAFGVGGVPEMIVDQVTGYCVEPENIQLLGEALYKFSQLTHLERKEMSAAARSLAVKKYSPTAVARQYIEVYSSLLTKP